MADIFRDKSSNLFGEQIQTLLGPKEKEINGRGEKMNHENKIVRIT